MFHFSRFACLAAVLGLAGARAQAQPQRVYLAPDDHTDYLWSADEDVYRQAFLETLDFYLDQIEKTKSAPPALQARWNCDGWLWLATYERNRTPAQFAALMNRVKDGHISAPLTCLVSTYGGQNVESVIRGMEYPGALERRFGMRFPLAVSMENQTLPLGLSSLWAGAGAQFSWRGVCGCVSKIDNRDLARRDHEIYWSRGLDGNGVLLKWNSMHANDSLGGYAEARRPAEAVNYATGDADFLARYRAPGAPEPYRVFGVFGVGWDDLKTLRDDFPALARSLSDANRSVVVSNERDFFEDFQTTHGAALPTQSVSFGNEWDLLCASLAEPTSVVKRSVEQLRAAEGMATLVARKNPGLWNSRKAARDNFNQNLGLYWEHDWTGDGPVPRDTRARWQKRLSNEIAAYCDDLQSAARRELSVQIPLPKNAGQRFWVYNPLGWTRTARVEVPFSGTTAPLLVNTSTGQSVPVQLHNKVLRFLATDVPALGFQTFEVRPGPAPARNAPAQRDAATIARQKDGSVVLSNAAIRVVVAPAGSISSLRRATSPTIELAQTQDGRALNSLSGAPIPGAKADLQIESRGPVSVTLVSTSSSPLPRTTRVTIARNGAWVELDNKITANFSDVRDWAFPFNVANPTIRHEEVGAILTAKRQSEGGHYGSARLSRTDWLTLNHFADVSNESAGVTLSNWDCSFFRAGRSTPNTLDTATPAVFALAGGQVDGENLGIRNQGGDTEFRQRFALWPHGAYNPGAAMRFALEHQNPLVGGAVQGTPNAPLPAMKFSLLQMSNPHVLVWAVKPAEDDAASGAIVRAWNVSNQKQSANLGLAETFFANAVPVSHIETPLAPQTASQANSETFAPQQIRSWKANFQKN